jgi:O-antigen/teichoic acid export membrane protein
MWRWIPAERAVICETWWRCALGLGTGVPLMFLFAAFYRVAGRATPQEAEAMALSLALLFANISDAISSVFIAYEKMEYPASTSTAIALIKIALGALVILPPFDWGFVGLAGVSLVMNVVQMIWLYILLRRKVLPPIETPPSLDRSSSDMMSSRR